VPEETINGCLFASKLPKEELSDLLNPNQKIVYITVTNYVTRYVSLTLQEPTSLPSSQSKQVLPSSFTANQATLFTSPLMELPSPSSSPQSPTTIVSEIITPTTTNSHVQKFADSVVPVEYTTSNADLFTFSTPTSSTIDYISTSGTVTPTGTTTDTNTHLSITTDQNNPHTTLSENQLKSIIVGKKYSSTLTSSKVKATSIQATTTTNIKYNMARKKLTTRLKVTTACGNCQKRKIKCSGETPCSYCVKINKPCLPGKPGKKRGPPPGTEVNKNRKKFINTSFSQFNNSYHYQQRHVVNYSPDCGQDYDDININNSLDSNPNDLYDQHHHIFQFNQVKRINQMIGNGTEPTIENNLIWLSDEMIVHPQNGKDPIDLLIDTVYPNLIENSMNITFMMERAKLTPLNNDVDEING
ncbi:19287_t:CDS:2, partial [Entrophospora sp. SA101]